MGHTFVSHRRLAGEQRLRICSSTSLTPIETFVTAFLVCMRVFMEWVVRVSSAGRGSSRSPPRAMRLGGLKRCQDRKV